MSRFHFPTLLAAVWLAGRSVGSITAGAGALFSCFLVFSAFSFSFPAIYRRSNVAAINIQHAHLVATVAVNMLCAYPKLRLVFRLTVFCWCILAAYMVVSSLLLLFGCCLTGGAVSQPKAIESVANISISYQSHICNFFRCDHLAAKVHGDGTDTRHNT